MRTLCALTACLILLTCSSAAARTITVDPGDPTQLVTASYTAGRTDTVFILPGTYTVGGPIHLTSDSPSYVGVGGPEGVILLGTGVEQAFFLDEFTWDAHIHLEGITFRGLAEIIGRVSVINGAGGEIHFTDNIIEECGSGALYPALRATECWGIIARNEFRDNPGYAIGTYHTSAAIEDNEIYGCLGGIRDQCCTSPAIRRNHVHDNLEIGIDTGYYEGGPIEHNLIEGNGTGLSVGSLFMVEHNVIRENARGVSSGGISGSYSELHYNDIYDNEEYNLLSSGYIYLPTQDCTMNWWGSVDPMVIAEGIVDCHDDPELGICVVFEPFCTAPGCDVTPVEASSWGSIKALYRR